MTNQPQRLSSLTQQSFPSCTPVCTEGSWCLLPSGGDSASDLLPVEALFTWQRKRRAGFLMPQPKPQLGPRGPLRSGGHFPLGPLPGPACHSSWESEPGAPRQCVNITWKKERRECRVGICGEGHGIVVNSPNDLLPLPSSLLLFFMSRAQTDP